MGSGKSHCFNEFYSDLSIPIVWYSTSMKHRISADRTNLHGIFHQSISPRLWVDSGDVVSFQTLEVGWRTEPVLPNRKLAAITPRDPVLDNGPALTGPVAIRGAEPGMALEIETLRLQPAPWGWTSAGGPRASIAGLAVESLKASLFWEISVAQGTARDHLGHEVPLSPFLGTIGLASHDEEMTAGRAPHPRTGGNLDAKVLGVGSSLFLPVEVIGGLLSVGDGHACQGDGEIAGTAIECPMEEAELRLTLHPNLAISAPRARTREGHWVTFGLGTSLDDAARMAINGMLDLILEKQSWTRSLALAWASSRVDLRITQMVNPLKGVHAMLSREYFPVG